MSHRFVRCPHCKTPHDAAVDVCPTTGLRMPRNAKARSRMSELPPPERPPEPLGFDAAKHRIFETREPAWSAAPQPVTESHQVTASLREDLIGRTISGRYLIRGVLGEGGMGMVYEGEHLDLGRPVAIKVLNPAQAKKRVAVKRFQQEARAAGAIGHPNICEVYDLGLLDDGSPYLVMEKLTGTTLADRISREGVLPFDEVADVMVQVLSGLIAAHEKGIVHRDIKPENIFLARRAGCAPIAKILDFGVSKMMPQFQVVEEHLDLTRTGMVMGTPYYMSPEQACGERSLDGRVDVYACGVMMYEAIVGKRPFLAPNYNALLLAIINTTPIALRSIRPSTPAAMEAIVTRMMTKAREDRYPGANAALRDIQALAFGAPAGSRMTPPPTPAVRGRAGTAKATGAEDFVDDMPTTVLRPAAHRGVAGAASQTGGVAGAASQTGGVAGAASRTRGAAGVPSAAAPVPSSARAADDWDIETVVKPAELTTGKHRNRQPSARLRHDKSFNPDETVNLQGEIEVDFSDDTSASPPPRRSR